MDDCVSDLSPRSFETRRDFLNKWIVQSGESSISTAGFLADPSIENMRNRIKTGLFQHSGKKNSHRIVASYRVSIQSKRGQQRKNNNIFILQFGGESVAILISPRSAGLTLPATAIENSANKAAWHHQSRQTAVNRYLDRERPSFFFPPSKKFI